MKIYRFNGNLSDALSPPLNVTKLSPYPAFHFPRGPDRETRWGHQPFPETLPGTCPLARNCIIHIAWAWPKMEG
eukprot:6423978-Pyramimonas_sp.AAC.1